MNGGAIMPIRRSHLGYAYVERVAQRALPGM
jgi:hypothetical protein